MLLLSIFTTKKFALRSRNNKKFKPFSNSLGQLPPQKTTAKIPFRLENQKTTQFHYLNQIPFSVTCSTCESTITSYLFLVDQQKHDLEDTSPSSFHPISPGHESRVGCKVLWDAQRGVQTVVVQRRRKSRRLPNQDSSSEPMCRNLFHGAFIFRQKL